MSHSHSSGKGQWIDLSDPESLIAGLLVLFAIVFNLYHLYPEVAIEVPVLNDGVLHLLGLGRSVDALVARQGVSDPWLPSISLGYPLTHHYQHLSYFAPSLLYLPLRGALSLPTFYNWVRYLLLGLFPLSTYWSVRRFGFPRLVSAMGGLVCSLLATDGLYGFGLGSYVWRGYGMYTQLWGMVLLLPALAQGYAALKTGRGVLWAVLLLAATALSHLVLGYIALISLAVLALSLTLGTRPWAPWRTGARLILLLILVAGVTAYFWVPFLLDRAYMNRSVWEDPTKTASYGYEWILRTLVRGELFDFDRFPSLTLLAAGGLGLCLWRWRVERYRVPVILFVTWLLLYCGRPTWGVLLDLLPLGGELHLHRLIAGVHTGGILMIGLGLASPWQWALARQKSGYLLAATALTALVLLPVYRERGEYLRENARMMRESRDALVAEGDAVTALTGALQSAPPGRVYAGLGGNWGKDYTVGAVPVYALLNVAELDMVGYLYHALSLNADILVLLNEHRPEQYDLFNVRYVVAPADRSFPPFVQQVGAYGKHRLYQVETGGYFDLVGSDVAFAGDRTDFFPAASQWLASELPGAKQHPAIFLDGKARGREVFDLSQAGEILPNLSSSVPPIRGRIVQETVENSIYQAEVAVDRASTLMCKVTYHPNWRAYVDGVEVETVMLMPSYVGIAVPPGTHDVRLVYRPRALRGGLAVAGLLTIVLTALVGWRREALSLWIRSRPVWATAARYAAILHAAISGAASWRPLATARDRLVPHLPYLAVVTAVTLLCGLPLLQFKIMGGHDALAYLPRTVEFVQGLRGGQIYPRWAPDLGTGYGEPTFNYNAPLMYALSALFHALGFGFIAAQNLACLVLLYLAGVGMYVLGQEVFGPRGGLVSAVAYLFAPYLLVALYVRYALADYAAFAFIPLTFWGLYRYVLGARYAHALVGTLSLALLILSSNSVSLLVFPAVVLFVIWLTIAEWRGGKSQRSTNRLSFVPVLVRGLACLALGLGLATFFWLPALAEREYVHVYRRLAGYLDFHNHFVYLSQFFSSPWGYGLSLPGPEDGLSFAVGAIHLTLTGAALLSMRRIWMASRRAAQLVSFFVTLGLGAAFFASYGSTFFWERLSLLHPLQFPWRFLSLVAPSTAFVCGFPFLLLRRADRRLANGALVAAVAALFVLGFPHARPQSYLDVTDADYSPERIAATGLQATARQFEPIWVQELPQAPAAEPLTILGGRGRVLTLRRSPTYYEFSAQVLEQARMRVNIFYFPGWTLYVDGVERDIDHDNPQGTIEFWLETGDHLVQVLLSDTPVRLWSTRASLLSLVLLLLIPWMTRSYAARRAQRTGAQGGASA